MSGFDPGTLAAIAGAREVTIRTAHDGSTLGTVIWVVVDEAGRVLVRSVRGRRGRWFRDLVADPVATLAVEGRDIPVRALPATDPTRVQACSDALAAKYARSRASLASMLRENVLDTTLELVPG